VIAIPGRLRDHKEAVHRIVERIAGLAATARETALAQLLILAGLRHLSGTVEQETRNMPNRCRYSGTRGLGTHVSRRAPGRTARRASRRRIDHSSPAN
jgi:hypothetical protein